jgi:hypothetical protein
MYNTKIICTYNTPEVFLDTDIITDYEKDFIRNAIYRQELLNIFEMENNNEILLNNNLTILYDKIKDCNILLNCTQLAIQKLSIPCDIENGFCFLFSYDYMDLTHICISEFLETGIISEKNILKLKDKILQ